jgi:outer membrane lipase/esterase
MRTTVRRSICLLALSGFMSSVYAEDYSKFYFFGDSLSDVGNHFAAPLTNGRGNLWTDVVAEHYGKDNSPSDPKPWSKKKTPGNDYAVVGADTDYLVNEELPKFEKSLAAAHTSLDSHALYSVWAGSNDLFPLGKIPPEQQAAALVKISEHGANNLVTILNKLHDLGARYLLLLNITDLGLTPEAIASGNPGASTTAAAYFNQLMQEKINALSYDVLQLDIFSLLQEVVANAKDYGFTNTTGYCNSRECTGYLFFNEVHPSVAGQQIIGDYVLQALDLPRRALLLTQLPSSAFASQNRIIEQNLAPRARPVTPGKAVFFAGSDYSKDNNVAQLDNVGTSNSAKNINVTTGLLYAVNQSLTTGASFSYNHSSNAFAESRDSAVNWDAKQLALFANYNLSKAYINAIVSAGSLAFRDMHRMFHLGPLLKDARASAKGHLYGAHLSSGLQIMKRETFSTGPFLTADYTSVTVNPYTEQGAGASNMIFERQKRGYFSSGLGWEANLKQRVGQIDTIAHVFVAGNRQWFKGDEDIHFHVGNIDGAHSSLPVITHNSQYLSTGINLAAQVTQKLGLSVGYEFDKGNYELKQHNFMVNLQYRVN